MRIFVLILCFMLCFNFCYASHNQQHYESVGGVFLGMTKNQLINMHGQPSKIEGVIYQLWIYDNLHFEVYFYNDFISWISVSKDSNFIFDKSNLTAKNSRDDFIKKYNAKIYNKNNFGLNIGHGEIIYVVEGRKVILTR